MTSLLVSIALAGACTGGAVALSDDEVVLRTWPVAAEVDPGQDIAFAAWLVHASGDSVPAGVDWTASAGTIDADGRFTAPGDPGAVLVVARDAAGSGRADTSRVTVRDPDPRVPVSIQLIPASVSLHVGASSHLRARVANALGALLDGVAVQWTSSASEVVRVDAEGGLLAVAEGSARVVATVAGEALADTAEVRVVPPAVASVEVSPAALSLTIGAGAVLTATPRDDGGAALVGRTVTWSTADGGVATVDGAGTVSAVAAGATTITATVEGVSGSAAVRVTAPGGAGLADECGSPGPGWVWCDDFDQDRLGSYFEFDAAGGSFQRTAGVGVEGSSAMRAQFAPGQVGAGALHLALGRMPQAYMRPADAGTADYRELYWRMYVRYDPGWIGGGGEKLSRAFIFASPSTWAQAMIAHVWSGGANESHLVIDPARGTDEAGNLVTTQYNDFANMTWLGAQPSATPVFDAAHVGRWYCIEAHVRLNTAGQSDGLFQLWIDDGLEARRTGLNWLGAFDDYGLNAVYVENFWNDGAPREQGRTIDNFVVGTQRIGC